MVGVVAGDDLPQPLPLPGNGLVHPPSQLLLDHPELRLHAVAAGLPIDLEVTSTRLATDEGKAQEREGLRLAKPAPRSVRRCLLRDAGWLVNDKRVERIWRREGLKVPQKQPKRGRLWLADGSCIQLRP